MATDKSIIDFLLDQLSSLRSIRVRKMFGEYALYFDDKVVGFVCDNQLFMKHSEAEAAFREECSEAPPYPGAKNYLLVPEEKWEDREWITSFIEETAAVLPRPKPKVIK